MRKLIRGRGKHLVTQFMTEDVETEKLSTISQAQRGSEYIYKLQDDNGILETGGLRQFTLTPKSRCGWLLQAANLALIPSCPMDVSIRRSL